MRVIHAVNVNDALQRAVDFFKFEGNYRRLEVRGQMTLEALEPVTTVYANPTERVLFNQVRDANPFFHLMEALWIIAGRRDVKFLEFFNSNMKNFSDDGKTFHAPYGHRLRFGFGMDQIEQLIQMLRADPDTRQAVLTIWDPWKDLSVEVKTKDRPCNDMIFFKIREGQLHMTVNCRSNDIIWGTYGTNVVQFSMLQEYIALSLDVAVGQYRQVSDSFHVYVDNPKWPLLRDAEDGEFYDQYRSGRLPCQSICLMTPGYPAQWNRDLTQFFKLADNWIDCTDTTYAGFCDAISAASSCLESFWFNDVALPMLAAYIMHKRFGETEYAKNMLLTGTPFCDWKVAGVDWLDRRLEARERRNAAK